MTTVRIRGIYATALTAALSEDHEIVLASEPIRERFDEELPDAPAAVEIETSEDRQGVSVAGEADAVDRVVSDLLNTGIDTLSWSDPVPVGAVFDGRITERIQDGSVVDLGESGAGYLPDFDPGGATGTGKNVRVQIETTVAPWSDNRPVLRIAPSVSNGLARLVRDEQETQSGTNRTIEFGDLIPAEPRDGWTVRWADRVTQRDVGFDAMAAALRDLNDRAAHVDVMWEEDADEPTRLTKQFGTTWVWFGRESRFGLDEHRRVVTSTMVGHHRIKAGSQSASGAVDFAEAVCDPDATTEFPFSVTSRQFGPRLGDRVALVHGKPDGRCFTLGRGEVTEYDPAGVITIERKMSPGGSYDGLEVEKQAGDVAVTKLKEGRWWYPTVYRGSEGERRGTYVNVCTPVELFPQEARYVDLHVDVVKHADGTTERVDSEELAAATERGEIPEPLAEKARTVATAIERAISD